MRHDDETQKLMCGTCMNTEKVHNSFLNSSQLSYSETTLLPRYFCNTSNNFPPSIVLLHLPEPKTVISKINDYYRNVVQRSAVKRLQRDALRSVVGFVQSFLDEGDRLLVRESVPQSVGGQNDEHGPVVGEVERQNVRVGDQHLLVLQGVIAQGPRRGQDTRHPPHAVERYETAGLDDPLLLAHLLRLVVERERDRAALVVAHDAPRVAHVGHDEFVTCKRNRRRYESPSENHTFNLLAVPTEPSCRPRPWTSWQLPSAGDPQPVSRRLSACRNRSYRTCRSTSSSPLF